MSVPADVTVRAGTRGRTMGVMTFLVLLLVVAVTWSVKLGHYHIGIGTVWLILLDNNVPNPAPGWTDVEESVVELVGLARVLAAALIGAGLAVSGAALQGCSATRWSIPASSASPRARRSAARLRF